MENIIEYFDTVHAPALILTLDAQKILSNLASILLNRLWESLLSLPSIYGLMLNVTAFIQ